MRSKATKSGVWVDFTDPLFLNTLRKTDVLVHYVPQLALLMRRQMEPRKTFKLSLTITADEHLAMHLQEPYFTERNGRLVLP